MHRCAAMKGQMVIAMALPGFNDLRLFFTFLAYLTHHLTVVEVSEKKTFNFGANVLNSYAEVSLSIHRGRKGNRMKSCSQWKTRWEVFRINFDTTVNFRSF